MTLEKHISVWNNCLNFIRQNIDPKQFGLWFKPIKPGPALKNADIGIAMGKNGTDVAKNAADMILADDNFVTIVEAVKQGRNIYDNIRKAIHFLIATNIGEIVTIFMGLILGLESPLLAIQL